MWIVFRVFWPNFGQKRSHHVMDAACPTEVVELSVPKSQTAIAAILLRRAQISRKIPRKSAIFAWNAQNEIVIASDGNSQLEIRNRNRKNDAISVHRGCRTLSSETHVHLPQNLLSLFGKMPRLLARLSSQTWLFQTWLFASFTWKCPVASICAPLLGLPWLQKCIWSSGWNLIWHLRYLMGNISKIWGVPGRKSIRSFGADFGANFGEIPDPPTFLFWKKEGEPPQKKKKKGFLIAEPLESLEKKRKTHKTKAYRKTKKGKQKKTRTGGSGFVCFEFRVLLRKLRSAERH